MKSSVASVNRASWSRCCDRHGTLFLVDFTSLHISISFSLSRHDMLWPDHHHQRRPLGGRPGPRPPGRFEFKFKFAALVLAALALVSHAEVMHQAAFEPMDHMEALYGTSLQAYDKADVVRRNERGSPRPRDHAHPPSPAFLLDRRVPSNKSRSRMRCVRR